MLLASVVAILTCVTVANATQTITTPNAAFIAYNLAMGTSSAAITPATNRSVLIMGCCTTTGGDQGVGHVSLLHISGGMAWVGLESPSGFGPEITEGLTGSGPHIVFIDFAHTVDIEAASADTIRIHNGAAATRAGNVTLVW
jgi:hypothetical protein